MAANFQQHMGAAGQMMPQQPPQPNQQQQPQPQRQGHPAAQINYHITQALKSQTQPRAGWQMGVTLNERLSLIYNL